MPWDPPQPSVLPLPRLYPAGRIKREHDADNFSFAVTSRARQRPPSQNFRPQGSPARNFRGAPLGAAAVKPLFSDLVAGNYRRSPDSAPRTSATRPADAADRTRVPRQWPPAVSLPGAEDPQTPGAGAGGRQLRRYPPLTHTRGLKATRPSARSLIAAGGSGNSERPQQKGRACARVSLDLRRRVDALYFISRSRRSVAACACQLTWSERHLAIHVAASLARASAAAASKGSGSAGVGAACLTPSSLVVRTDRSKRANFRGVEGGSDLRYRAGEAELAPDWSAHAMISLGDLRQDHPTGVGRPVGPYGTEQEAALPPSENHSRPLTSRALR